MTGPFARILSVLGLMALFAAAAPAVAGDDSSAAPNARALIEQQLDALARDDASGAYALAAPAIKSKFADPEWVSGDGARPICASLSPSQR